MSWISFGKTNCPSQPLSLFLPLKRFLLMGDAMRYFLFEPRPHPQLTGNPYLLQIDCFMPFLKRTGFFQKARLPLMSMGHLAFDYNVSEIRPTLRRISLPHAIMNPPPCVYVLFKACQVIMMGQTLLMYKYLENDRIFQEPPEWVGILNKLLFHI